MAASRVQSVFTYRSGWGSALYYFDVIVNEQGRMSVRNIRAPTGLIQDAMTDLPQSVMDDIQSAIGLSSLILTDAAAATGTVVFQGETSKSAAVTPGILNNTNYRVAYTTSDGMLLTTEDLSTVGFTVVAPAAYGSPTDPKTVGWTVLAATVQTSSVAGALTFVASDSGAKTVTFTTAFPTDQYRVVLTPRGFFVADVLSQNKRGFTVRIGITLGAAESVVVGYDVFA